MIFHKYTTLCRAFSVIQVYHTISETKKKERTLIHFLFAMEKDDKQIHDKVLIFFSIDMLLS